MYWKYRQQQLWIKKINTSASGAEYQASHSSVMNFFLRMKLKKNRGRFPSKKEKNWKKTITHLQIQMQLHAMHTCATITTTYHNAAAMPSAELQNFISRICSSIIFWIFLKFNIHTISVFYSWSGKTKNFKLRTFFFLK